MNGLAKLSDVGSLGQVSKQPPIEAIIRRLGGEPPKAQKATFAERMRIQTQNLQLASAELDELLREMKEEAASREAAVSQLEGKVIELAEREQALQSRVEALSVVSPRAVQEFVTLLEEQQTKGERRSARRDYILFALGVLVTIALTFVFNFLGLGG